MSIPDDTSEARNSESAKSASEVTEPTFQDQVNTVAKQLKKSDAGVWEFPDDVKADESVKYAAMLEKRRRDTESALGKTRLQLKTEEELRAKLETRAAAKLELNMSPDEAEELEVLREDDPEAWRLKVNELEQKATVAFQEELSNDRSSVSQQTELERREVVLKSFNTEHSDAPVTDEALQNDIPPRITNKLASNEVTFEEFLTEAYEFLTRSTVVKGETVTHQPNLGDVGGGSDPASEAVASQDADDYSKTVF